MDFDLLSVAFPCFSHSNTLLFSSAYNSQVIVGDDEPEERLIGRFRREVSKAGVLRECKRRRFFETSQERRRRKTREEPKENEKGVHDQELRRLTKKKPQSRRKKS